MPSYRYWVGEVEPDNWVVDHDAGTASVTALHWLAGEYAKDRSIGEATFTLEGVDEGVIETGVVHAILKRTSRRSKMKET